MPSSAWPYLDQPGVLAFAHRGGSDDAPENTMAAFAAAVAQGYRYLETDAHLTADGVIVAFHDHALDRLTDRHGAIAGLRWSEVAQARIGGQPIPRLEELLTTFPDARVNIDPKHDAVVAPLAELLTRLDALDRVGIGAFSDRRLAELRRRCGPRLCTSLGPRHIVRLKAASLGVPVGAVPAPCVQVPVGFKRLPVTDRRLVDEAHRRGMQVHVWTVNDAEEMRQLLDLGVDGIMTDRPAVLRQVLESRGAWPG